MAKQMPYGFWVSGKCCHHLMTYQHMMILAGSAQEKLRDLKGRKEARRKHGTFTWTASREGPGHFKICYNGALLYC